jgi:hypothetical protein
MNCAFLSSPLLSTPVPPPKVISTQHLLFLVFSVLVSPCDSLLNLPYASWFLSLLSSSDWVFFGVFSPTYTQLFLFFSYSSCFLPFC